MTTKKTKPRAAKKVSAARRQSSALAKAGDFAALVERVVAIIEGARSRVVRTVNSEMVLSNWHIGREIVEYVQHGEPRAEYGAEVIEDLSRQLQSRVGRGYSTTNLKYFRLFYLYLRYRDRRPEIRHAARDQSGEPVLAGEFVTSLVTNSSGSGATRILHETGAECAEGFSSRLSWSHYRALLSVGNPTAHLLRDRG